LVKTDESRVILCNAFPNIEAISLKVYWTPLDLTYGGRNCLLPRFHDPTPTKEIRLLQDKLINKKFRLTIKHAYNFRGLQTEEAELKQITQS
jgi:hypothetical protein